MTDWESRPRMARVEGEERREGGEGRRKGITALAWKLRSPPSPSI